MKFKHWKIAVTVVKKGPKIASIKWVDFWHIACSVWSSWDETGLRVVPRHWLSALSTYSREVRHIQGNLRGWMIGAFQEACEWRTATGWVPEGRRWDLKKMNKAENWNETDRWCPVHSRPAGSVVGPCMICPIASEYICTLKSLQPHIHFISNETRSYVPFCEVAISFPLSEMATV